MTSAAMFKGTMTDGSELILETPAVAYPCVQMDAMMIPDNGPCPVLDAA